MKKLFVLGTLLALISPSFANTANNVEVETAPRLHLYLIDISTEVPRTVGNVPYSVSNEHLRLCWTVSNMQFEPSNRNHVIEKFTSPSEQAVFIKPGATITKEKNVTILRSMKSSINGEYIVDCWQFDKDDPLGKYQLAIQVNNILFDDVEFEVVR